MVAMEVRANKVDFFSELPEELLTLILRYLTSADLYACANVSKLWYDVIRDSSIWKKVCKRHFYVTDASHQPTGSTYYRYLLRHLNNRLHHLEDNLDVTTFSDVIKEDEVTCYHQHGRRIAAGTRCGNVKVRDLSGHLDTVLETETEVCELRIQEDTLVVSGGDGSLARWSVRTGLRGAEYTGHRGFYPTGIQIVNSEDLLVASFVDYYVRVWRLSSGQLIHAVDIGTPIVGFNLCHAGEAPEETVTAEPTYHPAYFRPRGGSGIAPGHVGVSVRPSPRPSKPSPSGLAYILVINTGNDVSTYKFDPRTHALIAEDLQEVETSADCFTRRVFSLESRDGEIWALVQQTEFGVSGATWWARNNTLVFDIEGPGRSYCYSRGWHVYEYPGFAPEHDVCNFSYVGCGRIYDVLSYTSWDLRRLTWRDRICIYRKDWGRRKCDGAPPRRGHVTRLIGNSWLKHEERTTPSLISGPDVTWLDGLDGRNDRGLFCASTYRRNMEASSILCMDTFSWSPSTLISNYIQLA